jgi:hypothetical protein
VLGGADPVGLEQDGRQADIFPANLGESQPAIAKRDPGSLVGLSITNVPVF